MLKMVERCILLKIDYIWNQIVNLIYNYSTLLYYNTGTKNGRGVYHPNSELNCQQLKDIIIIHWFSHTFKQYILQNVNRGGLHAITTHLSKQPHPIYVQINFILWMFNTNILRHKIQHWEEVDYHWKPMQNSTSSSMISFMMMVTLTLIQWYSQAIVQSMVEQCTWMMIQTLVHMLATQAQNASFKCLVIILYYILISNHKAWHCISLQTMLKIVILGFTLYGGLLDRCAVSWFAEGYVECTHCDSGGTQWNH